MKYKVTFAAVPEKTIEVEADDAEDAGYWAEDEYTEEPLPEILSIVKVEENGQASETGSRASL